jgi:hypothetical protein
MSVPTCCLDVLWRLLGNVEITTAIANFQAEEKKVKSYFWEYTTRKQAKLSI